MRNAIGPTLALTGVQFTFLIGGTVIVERIFAYPGIGNMAIDAVINRDLPLIQGLVLVFAVIFIADQHRGRSARRAIQSEAPSWLERDRLRSNPTLRTLPAQRRQLSSVISDDRDDGVRDTGNRQHELDGAAPARRSPQPKVTIGGGFILALIVIAIFAPWIAPKNPLDQDLMLGLPAAGGTCRRGAGLLISARTTLAATCFRASSIGSRIALIVAFVAASLAALHRHDARAARGLVSRLESTASISRLVDIWMAFPPVLLSILLVAVLGAGVGSVIAAIAIIDWTRFCRVVRAETMAQAQADYVDRRARHRIPAVPYPDARDLAQRGPVPCWRW